MRFRRSLATLLAATVATVVVACTGKAASPTTTHTASTSPTPPATAYPTPGDDGDAVHPPEPLVGQGGTVLQRVVVGSSTTDAGVVNGVSAVFAPGTRRLVAGALVLTDAPAIAEATVTWSVETNVGERTLFSATAMVQPRSVLLSRARSDGALPQGIYRVRVTVGPESRDAIFVVSPLADVINPAEGDAPSSGLRSRTVPESGASTTVPPVVADAVVLTSDGTSDVPPAACGEAGALPGCDGWFAATSPSTTPPCPEGHQPTLLVDQDMTTFGAHAAITATTYGCTAAEPLALAAGIAGTEAQPIDQGEGEARWSGTTCDLPGQSDLFGDAIQVVASPPDASRQASTAVRLAELGPFTGVPVTEPPLGDLVTDLQTIRFTAFAVALGATRGIKTLSITAPDGTVLAHAGRPQAAAACDLNLARFQVFASGTYTVQQDGKSVVELTLRAETFDGSVAEYPLRWPKQPTWSGALQWHVVQPVASGTQLQDMAADVVVSETGPNMLTGTVRGRYSQTRDAPDCSSHTAAAGSAVGTISGSLDDSGMHLAVTPEAGTVPTLGACAGGVAPDPMDNPLTASQLFQLLDALTPQGNNRYSATLDVTLPDQSSVRARLTLRPLDQDPVDAAAFSMSPAVAPPP